MPYDSHHQLTEHGARVREFMINANQACPPEPTIPDAETRKLRAKLILEEALETIRGLGVRVTASHGGDSMHRPAVDVCLNHASLDFIALPIDAVDIEEIVDGCADISVVTIGTLIACGVADAPILEEVDDANLRKFDEACPHCGREGLFVKTYNGDPEQGDVTCIKCGGTFRPGYLRADGKWMKPGHWTPPDIMSRLHAMGWKG